MVLGGGFCFRYRSSFDGENQRRYPRMLCFLQRLECNVQISLRIDLRDGDIQSSLTEVRPGRQTRFSDNVAVSVLNRIQSQHRAKLFHCDTLGSNWGVVFRPGVQADGILTTKSYGSWFLGKIIEEAFPAFERWSAGIVRCLYLSRFFVTAAELNPSLFPFSGFGVFGPGS